MSRLNLSEMVFFTSIMKFLERYFGPKDKKKVVDEEELCGMEVQLMARSLGDLYVNWDCSACDIRSEDVIK